MKFAVVSIFPEMIEAFLSRGIVSRARANKTLEIEVIQLRDYTHDAHRTTDDYVYGGGGGMVMKPAPVFECIDDYATRNGPFKVVFPSPQGQIFDSARAEELARQENLLFLCGRYEGIDERIMTLVDYELSIGSFVVSGGEIPALLMIDAISRFVPGVVGNERSVKQDSFYNGLLDHANWTRPAVYRGLEVPAVYVNGHHQEIEKARKRDSILRTILKHPKLFLEKEIGPEEKNAIIGIIRELSTDAG